MRVWNFDRVSRSMRAGSRLRIVALGDWDVAVECSPHPSTVPRTDARGPFFPTSPRV
jgi:hypothetical protein